MVPSRLDLAAFKLAVYLHDPPWKPWGIQKSCYKLTGTSTGSVSERIARALAEKYGRAEDAKSRLARTLGLRGGELGSLLDRLAEALSKVAQGATSIASNESKSCRVSHVAQSRTLLQLIAWFLEELGADTWAKVARRAHKRLACRDNKEPKDVHIIDVYASSFDRNLIAVLYAGDRGSVECSCSEPGSFVNSFNPSLKVGNAKQVKAEKIADYVAALIVMIGLAYLQAVKGQGGGSGGTGAGDPMLLYELVYSLAEPLWYYVLGWGYVPVADTRVPHHTVFDHAAAAVMVSNWFLGDGYRPEGCLVVLDLASVQQWIGESRRLRDTWAASWLASWLAWMASRVFVEEYGPDVMLQPPARLHPFYVSWLLSRLGCTWANQGACGLLAELLGLPYGWPLDPTTPSAVKLVLPQAACKDAAERTAKGLQEAWSSVMARLAEYLASASRLFRLLSESGAEDVPSIGECEKLTSGEAEASEAWRRLYCALALHGEEILEHVKSLEAPLPLRVTVRGLGEARKKLEKLEAKIREELGKQGLGDMASGLDLEKLLLYQVLSDGRLWAEGAQPSAPGRRSGQEYLEYARSLHGKRAFLNCHVCGIAAAIIDGDALNKALAALRSRKDIRESRWEDYRRLRWLASNVGSGERLCPYCLAKRMLRDMLYRGGLAAGLVGLGMPAEVYQRLGRVSVDAYTSLTRRSYVVLKDIVESLVAGEENAKDLILAYMLGLAAPNSFLNDEDKKSLVKKAEPIIKRVLEENEEYRGLIGEVTKDLVEDLVTTAEAIVLEAVHDDAYIDYLSGRIGPLAEHLRGLLDEKRRELRGKRRYAILQADADMMGSGLLTGYLGLDAKSYAGKTICNIGSIRDDLIEAYAGLVEAYENTVNSLVGNMREEVCRLCGSVCGEAETCSGQPARTLIVTPSYHQALSRALAVQAFLDRQLVEDLKGLFLYSGGDDASAVLPPAESRGDGEKEQIGYPALDAAVALRRLYWGLPAPGKNSLSIPSGFNAATARGRVTVLVPALAAYGRSTAVYYVGVKEPFWLSFGTSHRLLDSKDQIGFCNPRLGAEMKKDSLIVASSGSGAAVLPLNPALQPATKLDWESKRDMEKVVGASVEAVKEILRSLSSKEISVSLLADAKNYVREAYMLSVEGHTQLMEKLLIALFRRNIPGQGAQEKAVKMLGKLSGKLGGADTAILVGPGTEAARYMDDGYSIDAEPPQQCKRSCMAAAKASLAILQAINAARITRGSS